ncbi:putative P-loop containing nucleoside triphosphate hydrolase, leucine-rich repeat domain superfamily [Helianthus annuus]|nr:putative P-loop containing nucleoside triphosphate hydrolase, leucine-rich repeat domain superfamily [Helianthus annuus]
MVGIWGVGGGGKTTLASAAYAELSHQFEAHCFLQNIREESNKHGLEKLQEKILSVALKTKDVVVGSEIEGRSTIQRRLCHKRVLVVLDDVDDFEQLEALAGSHDWFGEGSRIIITTRDKHLLSSTAHTNIYEVSLLSHYEAITLFNRHAYHKDKPIEDYEKLSLLVVSYAGGLPLALKVLGSFLYDKDKDEWKSTLAKLKCIPEKKVMEILKISYDGLEPYQKDLFLDIACFMRTWPSWVMDHVMMVLDACNLHPVIGIKVLEQKSLIKVSKYGILFEIHDLIEEMAHYIVRGEHPNNLEKHSRIWKWEDLIYLCDMGAAAPSMENEVLANISMYYRSSHPGVSDAVANMKNLRWILWDYFPASSFPSNFQPTKLRCLMLKNSKQKELWEGCKSLPYLKILDLSLSRNLIKTPDFEGLPCLERLILERCDSLEEIHPSIGYHKRLVFVNMTWCTALKRFPPIIHMKKLETLDLSYCKQLQQFPDMQSNMDSLVTLDLSWTDIEIIPPSVGRFCTNLVSFNLSDCPRLKRIEGNFHLLRSLKDLDLSFCKGLSFQHDESVSLPQFPRFLRKLNLSWCKLGDGDIPSNIFCESLNLQLLDLSDNDFSRLPSGISRLPGLKLLNLSHCWDLVELPDLPSSIAVLYANVCPSLEIERDLSDYKWLWKVSLPERTTNKRVLLSMLEEHAVKEDRFMSVSSPNVQPSSIYTRLVTLQLPHNWYSDFSGFLLSLRAPNSHSDTYRIVIKMSTDHSVKIDKDCREPYKYERVGYVPFSSLRHIPWFNPTYTQNISFQITDKYGFTEITGLNVELVRRKSKIGDLNEHPIDYSECWDEEDEDRKTFEITYDSKTSEIQISWKHW